MVTGIVYRGTVQYNMEQADSLYNGTAVSMDKTIPVTLRLNTEIIDILYYPMSIYGSIDERWTMGDGRWEIGVSNRLTLYRPTMTSLEYHAAGSCLFQTPLLCITIPT